MSGTELAYGATLYPELSWRMVLRDVRYWHFVCRYAISGTERAYGTTLYPVLGWGMVLRNV
eukprot:289468-Rhodomonas_salina.1